MFDQDKFDTLQEIQNCMAEAGAISRKAKISPEDSMRFNFLQQKVSLLKAGMTPDDFRRKQMTDLIERGEVRNFEVRSKSPAEVKAYIDFLKMGIGNRAIHNVKGQVEIRTGLLAGAATISATTGSAGGYFVPTGFYGGKLFQAMKQYDAIMDPDICTQITTDGGAALLISSSDDVENPATILSESSGDSSSDITVGQINLGGYSFRTPKLIFSREFDEDSFWPIATLLEKSAAVRLSIGVSGYLATGTGTAQPTGIVTAAKNAAAIVPAASTSLAYGDLKTLFFAPNAAYRANGTWLLNDNTLQAIRGLEDDNHRPLLDVTADGMTIFGRPVRLSPSLDDVGASKYPIVFGDCSYFVVRRAIGGEYALIYNQSVNLVEKGLSAARFFARYDSNLIAPASGSPVFALEMTS